LDRVSALDECLQHDATLRAQRLSSAALDRVSALDERLQHHATLRAQRLLSAVLNRVSALDECPQLHTIFLPVLSDNYDACFCVVFHPHCIRICMRARVIVF
jgi:hypothetical protein